MPTSLSEIPDNTRACLNCRNRSALIAAMAPAISRLQFTREGLLGLLSLPDDRLLRAAKVSDPDELMRRLELPLLTSTVPAAVCLHDPDYPEALAQLDCAPAVLYSTCSIDRLRDLLARPTVAIVGSRSPSDYARYTTVVLARDLAKAGVTVISGMNMGLEGIVHRGARDARGPTVAVMPAGPEVPYPSQNEPLQRYIRARGAAVSEFPPSFSPARPWGFLASQRIIAALASLIVVVEPWGHSCALFTAQIAADLGQDLAVVPARVTDPGGHRTFALLRDGAHPVACAKDVLDVIYRGATLGVAA